MIPRRLTGLVWNDRDTRVLVAVAGLHSRGLPVTTARVDRFLNMPRRNVERALEALEVGGLLEIHPGRPRIIVPAVGLVAWAEPNVGTAGASRAARVSAHRAARRGRGVCPHPLPARFARLCTACGDLVDRAEARAVSSTLV